MHVITRTRATKPIYINDSWFVQIFTVAVQYSSPIMLSVVVALLLAAAAVARSVDIRARADCTTKWKGYLAANVQGAHYYSLSTTNRSHCSTI
jgi:hypothetical protein